MARLDRRRFVLGTGALGLAAGLAAADDKARPPAVGGRLWLWGHPAGCHTQSREQWGLPGRSKIGPAEAAEAMGIRNLLMVRYDLQPRPPFAEYARPLAKLDRVVWSVEGGGGDDVEAALALRRTLPNLQGIMLDDYFGRVVSLAPKMWLAENGVRFPVSLTVAFPRPASPDRAELVQTAWHSGDYRSRDFALDLPGEGNEWMEAARGTLPNAPQAKAEVRLPGKPVGRVRVRIFSTHDADKARSCGLSAIRFFAEGKPLPSEGMKIEASSHYTGHPPANLLGLPIQDEGPFSLSALRRMRKRLDEGPRRLDLWVVLYTHEFAFGPLLQPHLELCDVVTMWTWQAADLARLERNFAEFEKIVGPRRRVLGLYLWDYGTKQPMPPAMMEHQCALGLKWLRQRRIDGMIFLASCLCDLELETVRWTRRWIAEHAADPIG